MRQSDVAREDPDTMLMHPIQLQRIAHEQAAALRDEVARDVRAQQYLAAVDGHAGRFARRFRRSR